MDNESFMRECAVCKKLVNRRDRALRYLVLAFEDPALVPSTFMAVCGDGCYTARQTEEKLAQAGRH